MGTKGRGITLNTNDVVYIKVSGCGNEYFGGTITRIKRNVECHYLVAWIHLVLLLCY